jgi:hypothetical protein
MSQLTWNPPQQHSAATVELPKNGLVTTQNIDVALIAHITGVLEPGVPKD